MQPDLVERLLDFNREFYDCYADSFSASRYSVQPGVQSLLSNLSQSQNLLDVGCGNGNLAIALQKSGFRGKYLGIDFSTNLLNHAVTTEQNEFVNVDLADSTWPTQFEQQKFDVITCFAVLHHLPGQNLQSQTLKNMAALLDLDGKLILSVWQPLSSPKLRKRVIPWQTIKVDPAELIPERDLLLDWRAEDQANSPFLRYIHQFTSAELDEYAQSAGLIKSEEWLSDGHEGNLALYQTWRY